MAFCDGGTADVISIKMSGHVYHFRIGSTGLLKNNDLCYYTYEGEYICEVKEVVKEYLHDMRILRNGLLYKQIDKINLTNIPIEEKGNGILYIFKDPISLEPDSVLASLEIISAENEFKYINIYSPDLEEKDNLWLEANPLEILFQYSAENCGMGLYTIKGKLTKSETDNLRTKIEGLNRKKNWELYDEELKKLYRRKIIMLGYCDC